MIGAGVLYLIRKDGGPSVEILPRGRFRWAGQYWQDGGGWGPSETAKRFGPNHRDTYPERAASVGGSWVPVFVNVSADGGNG